MKAMQSASKAVVITISISRQLLAEVTAELAKTDTRVTRQNRSAWISRAIANELDRR